MFRKILFLSIIFFISSHIQSQQIFQKATPNEATKVEAKKALAAIDYFDVNIQSLKKKLNTSSTIEIEIPLKSSSKTIVFEKTNILTPDYQLYTSSGKTLNTSRKYSFYHGSVVGNPKSKATMIFYNDELSISIFDGEGHYEINKDNSLYRGYFTHDLIEPNERNWDCELIEDPLANSSNDIIQSRSILNSECVTVFFEIDHNMYTKLGSDVAATEAWFLNLMLKVSIFYIEHNVPLNISAIQVWDTVDPYVSTTTTSTMLSLFRNTVRNNPNFNGRLAHLISGRWLGGGIAYLNSLCSTSLNVAVSTSISGFDNPFPNYSWDVMVVAHEIGHNMGSPHTHSCSWNGNNTAIDGCGSIEGSCPDPGPPPASEGGTIMSYCHLNAVGINFENGFGPQPGALIENKFITAPCVTGDNCSKVTPFNDVCDRSKELPVHNYCINGYFHNYETTPSGDGGNMTCGDTGVENDLWFNFEHIDVDTIHLKVKATQIITDLVVEIYTGDCDNLTSIDCDFSISGSEVAFEFHDPNLIDETIYIRIVEKGSDEEGEFSICLYSNELSCQNHVDSLLSVYQGLNGMSWINNSGWMNGDLNGACDYCNWYGITCNYLGEIIEIDLSNNNLQGKLPSGLTLLSDLRQLNLNNNLITDTIPNNYWDSLNKLLLLDLSHNTITGNIPSAFVSTDIMNIHLDHNSLSGKIPDNLGFNGFLRVFTARNNLLEGCFSAGSNGFCYKDSIDFINNANLPFNGDITQLCQLGWGADSDGDGFCFGIDDCNDYDAHVNPDAPEIICDAIDNNCNGLIDEGSNFGPNIWIGPDTLGLFEDASNWSLNHIPLICENVEIGLNGDTIDLIITGDGMSESLNIRSLTIGQYSTIHLPSNHSLSIRGNGVVLNNGIFEISGFVNIQDQINTSNTAFYNNGLLNILNNSGLDINGVGEYGIHNSSNGSINLLGNSFISSNSSTTSKNAILNEGIINVHGQLILFGSFIEEHVKNNGGVLDLKDGSFFSIYGND